jgi:Tol biopolymer transport system component/DNA-binding winged helix-turn-helix (wHTH) protein
MSSDKNHIYRFGDYQLDAAQRVLKRDGEILPLPLKPIEVLLVLVEQHGSVVSKEELMKRVWPDSFVEEANLARHIYMLRRTLGEKIEGDRSKSHYIQTIPGRGYRFACEVKTGHLATGVEEQGVTEGDEAIAESNDPSHLRTTHEEEGVAVASERSALNSSRKQSHRSWRLSGYHLLVAMIALMTSVILSVLLIITQARTDDPLPEPTITRLTSNHNVLVGSISPDGKYIVSIAEENSQRSVWTRLLTDGSEKQITPPSSFDLWGLAFSPDSSFVYYNATTKQNSDATLYQVPIIGGPISKIKGWLNSPVSFAPDGIRFAFVREDRARGRSSLLISSLNDDAEKELIWRETPEFLDYPGWSPDGARIICTFHTTTGGVGVRLLEVRLADGAEWPLPTPSWRYIRNPIWLKDDSGLVVNVEEGFLSNQAWFLPFHPDDERGPRRLMSGMRVWRGVSVTNDNRALVFTERSQYANVWVAPSAATGRATKITSGAGHYEDLTWTPDGRLLYASDANGFWNIWLMNADGKGRRQLTFDTYENRLPSMSPDGRYIFFTSIRDDFSAIWRMDADGSNLKQLTFGGYDFAPHCAPDGKWVLFTSYTNESAYTLRKVSVEGGVPETLSRNDVRDGILSPDSKFVACLVTEGPSSRSVEAKNLAVISLSDGAIRKLGVIDPYKVNHSNSKLRWMPDSSGIVYADSGDDYCNLWVQPLAGGRPQRLTDFHDYQIFSFAFSRDGRLAVLRGAVKNEIVRISNPNLKPGTIYGK